MSVVEGTRATSWAQRLDVVLFGPGSGRRLVFARTALAALITARLALSPFRELAEVPPALYDPAWVVPWRSGPPSVAVIALVQVLGVAAGIAAVARWRVRATFVVAWVALVVLAGLRTSRGKVLHNDLLLVWCAAPFLLAPVRASWHDTEESDEHGWPVRVAMALGALVYFFAGYHKLRRSGLDWALGDNVRYVMLWGPTIGRARWQSMATWVGEHLWAARLTGAYILSVELFFPLAVLWPKVRWFFVASAVALHVATWLLLGLDYWTWAATVLIVFVDWPALLDRRSARPQGAR
jgi:hypothetical protein